MAPPTYGDLGKNARDVFGKGYHFGLCKLDVKTKTTSGVEFSIGGVSNQDTGKVFGSLDTKYKLKDYGELLEILKITCLHLDSTVRGVGDLTHSDT